MVPIPAAGLTGPLAHTPPPAAVAPLDPGQVPHLAAGQLHELHAESRGWASALLFALRTMAQTAKTGGQGHAAPLLLVRPHGSARGMSCDLPGNAPYGEGLAMMGIDPARLLIVETSSPADLLRAAHEGARCAALGGVVVETWGELRDYDLVASRRLVLAAEVSGVPVAMLRGQARPRPSAAHTRWQVATAASAPVTSLHQPLTARLPGPAAITLALLRQRGGPAGLSWHLEWNEDHARFDLARPMSPIPARKPLFGAVMAGTVVSLSALRKDMARRNAA